MSGSLPRPHQQRALRSPLPSACRKPLLLGGCRKNIPRGDEPLEWLASITGGGLKHRTQTGSSEMRLLRHCHQILDGSSWTHKSEGFGSISIKLTVRKYVLERHLSAGHSRPNSTSALWGTAPALLLTRVSRLYLGVL
jgi:hypothetical protein